MVIATPTKYFLVAGAGAGISELNAFDAALIAAGVGNTNLVKLSSILPPGTRKIKPATLPQGALVPVAYAAQTSSAPGGTIAAAVAIAIPRDPGQAGLIMEYSAEASAAEVENRVVEMAAAGMAMRGKEIDRIEKVSVECTVARKGAGGPVGGPAGAAFAGASPRSPHS